ncbi:MAG: DUF2029 domain-containing protein [Clostridia bacterium]|nr:DUF2029 domain-containing protein [Clostridia bacterium]
MNKFRTYIGRVTPEKWFYFLSIAGVVGFLLYAFAVSNASAFNWLIMEHNGKWEFADYFAHVFFGKDLLKTYNSFDVDPCFPPLAYLFYHFMYRINPAGEQAMDRNGVMAYQYNMFLFVIYTVVTAVFFASAIQLYNERQDHKSRNGKNLILTLVALFSVPFFGSAIERGNAVFLVCVLLIYALVLRDSESKVNREIALILIAIAANFKLYPAIMGLMYIKEKRYKEAFRLIIYGGLLFIVPFIFFGGIEGIKDYLVIMYLMEGRSIERITTVRGLITSIYMAIGGEAIKWTGHVAGRVAENIYLIFALFGFWVSKDKWKSLFLLASPMVVYVSSAYRYTAVYLFLALLCFLRYMEDDKDIISRIENKKNYVYATLFGLLFTVPIWAIAMDLEIYMYIVIYVLLLLILIDVIWKYIQQKRKA